METISTAQEERRRMLEEFRKRKEELRNNGQALNKAPLSTVNSVRRLPETVKKNLQRVPFTATPAQRVTNKLPRTTVSNRLVLQQGHTRSLSSQSSSTVRTPANKSLLGRTTCVTANAVTSRLTKGTLSSSLKSQYPQSTQKPSPKTARRSRLIHKKRSPVAKRNSPRINLSAHRVTQVTLRRGPLNDVALTSLRKPAQRVEAPRYTMKTPRRPLRYATIATQTSPCMIVKLEPVNAVEPQAGSKQDEQIVDNDSENVAAIVHKFHLIQRQQMVESRKSTFTIPTPKILQVVDPKTEKIVLEEFIPSRGISLFRLSKVVEYAKTGDVEVTRAMFEILGAPPKSGTVHITFVADYWIERSRFEEKCGNIEEALNLLQKGKEMKAKPAKEIKTAINSFVGRHTELRDRVEFEPVNIRFQMDEARLSNDDHQLGSEVSAEKSNQKDAMNGSSSPIFHSEKAEEKNPMFQQSREVERSPFLSDDEDVHPPVLESNISFSEEESNSENMETTEENGGKKSTDPDSKEFEDLSCMLDQVALSESNGNPPASMMTPSKGTRKGRGKAGASSTLTSARRSTRLAHMDSPAGDAVASNLESKQPKKKLAGKRVDAVKEQLENEVENDSSQLVYACITPSRKLQQSLDCNVVLTPVRRSARLARNADKLPPSLRHHTQTFSNLSELPEDMDYAWVPNDSVDVRK